MPTRKRDNRDPSTESLLRLAERTNLRDDPEALQLVFFATATDNTTLERRIENLLGARATQQLTYPFETVGPPTSTKDQQIRLGVTTSGTPFQLKQDALTKHLLEVGQSGAGKTTLFYNLMDQVDIPFWAFDLKQDYRHLIQRQEDLLILPWTQLKFNPLKPPSGVPPRRWAQVFAEIFGHATALLSGSKNYVMKRLSELYQLYDIYQDGSEPYPSLHELQVMAERDKINYVRKTSRYRDTVLNRLEAMTLTTGTIFDCSVGYPIEEFLQRNVVFEFDGLGSDTQDFLMEILFAYAYEYRLAQNQRGGRLRHVFFLDEGKRIFSVYKERQDAAGIPAIDELTAKMREFGEGIVVADQEAGKLTDSIKANTYTKILLATGDSKQFREMAGSMNLSERQRELAQTLGFGEAIVQVGNGEPVPVRLEPYEISKTISNEELQENQSEHWNEMAFEPRHTPPAFVEAVYGDVEGDSVEQKKPDSGTELTEEAELLLKDVAENPFTPLTTRYDVLYSSRGLGDGPKNELVEKRYVVERRVRSGPRRKLLQLTEKGREYIEHREGFELNRKGRGGIVHQFWQSKIKEMLEEMGWTAKRELFDADVYAMNGGEIAVEVAMEDSERVVEHVENHLEGFDSVWIACRTKAVMNGITARLEKRGLLDEVNLIRCEEFLELDRESLDLDGD